MRHVALALICLLGLLGLLLAACFEGYAPTNEVDPFDNAPQPSGPAESGPLHACDGRLCDALGREVLLRGVNAGSAGLVAPYAQLDDPARLDNLTRWGLNALRIVVVWAAIEPAPGEYDDEYIERIAALAQAAGERNLWVVIDWHSVLYSSDLWGAGAPAWALPAGVEPFVDPPPADWYWAYLQQPVIDAYAGFYQNVELRRAEAAAHARLARRLADMPWVVGHELQFAPYAAPADSTFGPGLLTDYAAQKGLALRQADADALLLAAPPALRRPIDPGALPELELDGLAVSAPYFDANVQLHDEHDGRDDATRSFMAGLRDAADQRHQPALLSAWGVRPSTLNGAAFVEQFAALADSYLLHWFYWDLNPGGPRLNSEDFSLLDSSGNERPAAAALTRPYPAAVAGELTELEYDPAAAKLSVIWRENGCRGLTEVLLPDALYPDGFKVQLSDGEWKHDAARRRLLVLSDPAFGLHWLTIRPVR